MRGNWDISGNTKRPTRPEIVPREVAWQVGSALCVWRESQGTKQVFKLLTSNYYVLNYDVSDGKVLENHSELLITRADTLQQVLLGHRARLSSGWSALRFRCGGQTRPGVGAMAVRLYLTEAGEGVTGTDAEHRASGSLALTPVLFGSKSGDPQSSDMSGGWFHFRWYQLTPLGTVNPSSEIPDSPASIDRFPRGNSSLCIPNKSPSFFRQKIIVCIFCYESKTYPIHLASYWVMASGGGV